MTGNDLQEKLSAVIRNSEHDTLSVKLRWCSPHRLWQLNLGVCVLQPIY